MSREIKFRVWFSELNKMHHPGDSHLIKIFFDGKPWREPNHILEQFTGIKDKNNKDIYEGDIVKVTWEDNNPYGYSPEEWDENEETITVIYDAPSFNLEQRFSDGGQSCIQNFQREVIGNIHENPELIKL